MKITIDGPRMDKMRFGQLGCIELHSAILIRADAVPYELGIMVHSRPLRKHRQKIFFKETVSVGKGSSRLYPMDNLRREDVVKRRYATDKSSLFDPKDGFQSAREEFDSEDMIGWLIVSCCYRIT